MRFRLQGTPCESDIGDIVPVVDSAIDAEGALLQSPGECCNTTCPVQQFIAGKASSPTLKSGEYYVLATVAQGVLDVCRGDQPSFSRNCTTPRVEGSLPPCQVHVAPYIVDGQTAGATVQCIHRPNCVGYYEAK